MLNWTDLLDPRLDSSSNPITDSVAIPCDELEDRIFELPSVGSCLRLPPCDEAIKATKTLNRLGRHTMEASNAIPGSRNHCRLWKPNSWLESSTEDVKPGYALDIGCGAGREAVFLASLGWRVSALDILPDAIYRARLLEARYRSQECPAIEWHSANFRHMPSLEVQSFDLMVTCMIWSPMLIDAAIKYIRPDGLWIAEAFSSRNPLIHGKPSNRDWCLELNAESLLNADFCVEKLNEAETEDKITIRFLARRR